ncbi:PREDICTED: coiled-coil domain-containing protein 39-like [Priapulus caudatus]|uniref:Coiled-coil domain-containing protein 39 n=1 Tax=Priapulus caudatus TaxID=37621 RepID=A0ABM1EC39_PRICU|nr:PREDICTED: coiled-coil domain-containing protein 39-like [Priapulus caudatus]
MEGVIDEMKFDSSGGKLPISNAENKELETQLHAKENELVVVKRQLDEHEDRIHAMSTHTKNVRQELENTQGLLGARKNQSDTERHLLQLAQREEGRLRQEIRRLTSELNELNEKKKMQETGIFRQQEKLEQLKSQLNWDQQALEAWLEECARRDQDNYTLQKYTRQDESKIKELELQLEKRTEEAQRKRRALDMETTETLSAQMELDKAAEEFRTAHAARQELITQWELTIEQMQKRDRDIDRLAVDLSKAKQSASQREEMVKEKQRFLDRERENNLEAEKKLAATERLAAKLRQEAQNKEAQRVQFQDEVETLKRMVDRTGTELENVRAQVSQLKKDIQSKSDKLKQVQGTRTALEEKLRMAGEMNLSAEEYASRMQLHLQEYEAKHKKMEDYQIMQLESKIAKLSGDKTGEERHAIEAQVKELQAELDERMNAKNMLGQQLKQLQDNVRRVKKDMEQVVAEKATLTSKIEELNLHNDSSHRELKRLVSRKQDMMVDENLLKLEIRKLTQMLNSRSGEVTTLERRHLELETAMRERRQDVAVHRDMLRAQLKAASDEKATLSTELHERFSKIDKLRKRYEILIISMAPPEGEEEKSEAYYVIKAAQEKEELQRTGDELDAQIRKAEREMKALENTCRLMNSHNEAYRKTFHRVTENSNEQRETDKLNEQLRAVTDNYKFKRCQVRERAEDVTTMQKTLDNLNQTDRFTKEVMAEKDQKLAALQQEIGEQKAKLSRVDKQNAKYSKDLRASKKTKGETLEEKDFEVRDMRETFKNAMRTLGDVMAEHPEIVDDVNTHFSQAGLPPPSDASCSTPGSRTTSRGSLPGSRPASVRSSLSGAPSVRSPMGARTSMSSAVVSPTTLTLDVGSSSSPPGGAASVGRRASRSSSVQSGSGSLRSGNSSGSLHSRKSTGSARSSKSKH